MNSILLMYDKKEKTYVDLKGLSSSEIGDIKYDVGRLVYKYYHKYRNKIEKYLFDMEV